MQRTFSINIMVSNLEINLFFFLKHKRTSNKVKITVKIYRIIVIKYKLKTIIYSFLFYMRFVIMEKLYHIYNCVYTILLYNCICTILLYTIF